jgi:hypothetical protein
MRGTAARISRGGPSGNTGDREEQAKKENAIEEAKPECYLLKSVHLKPEIAEPEQKKLTGIYDKRTEYERTPKNPAPG